MKKLLFLFLSVIAFLPIKAQQSLTQIDGWNAYVHLPASYNNGAYLNYPTIIFYPGLGEIGTVASKVIASGPGAYIAQGWDGNVIVDGKTIEFIVISLQPPNAYPNEIILNSRLQTIKRNYRVDTNNVFLTGLSHGGWCSSTFVTGDAYGGPYTYASQIAAIVTVQGVVPDDNQPYPNLFDNFALSGGKLISFEQRLDRRGGDAVAARMNAAVAGSAQFIETNFGGGGHCCWNQFYGGQGTTPGSLINGRTIYEYFGKIAKETVVSLNVSPPGLPQNITYFTFSNYQISLKATRSTYYYICDAVGRIYVSGTTKPGVNTISIKNLASGFYIFKTYFGAHKIIKTN